MIYVGQGGINMRRNNGEGTWGTKTINGYEYVRYRAKINGSYKEFYGKTRKEVQNKVRSYETKIGINNNKNVLKMSIGSYLYEWLQTVRIHEIADGTYTTDYKTYRSYIKNSTFANNQIANIDTRKMQDYINSLSTQYARSTFKKIYTLYNLCFKYAIRVGDINFNPCKGVILPTEKDAAVKKKKIPYLDTDDIERLYNESYRLNTKEFRINGKKGTRVYGINALGIIIIMYTGLRSSELSALQWKDVDLKNKVLHVTQAHHKKTDPETHKESLVIGIPKYNSYRDIPLADRAIKAFRDILETKDNVKPTDFVISCQARRLASTLDRMLLRAGCEVEHCGLHAIRHTFGSMLLKQRVDLKTISVLLGHKDIQTTANIYLDVSDELAVNSVELLNKINND